MGLFGLRLITWLKYRAAAQNRGSRLETADAKRDYFGIYLT
jgi:hypothetical protein